ncbi:folate family ECF transporter S component [Lacticaseibacillus thailandensis]|nr:folate family ECF transporter S component [Lacticaseibacillus thailandensis]
MQIFSFRSPRLNTRSMVFLALLMALELVLARFSIGTEFLKVSPAFIATALMGYYFGPWWAAGAAIILDQVGFVLFGSGADFLGYTLSAAVAAAIYGILFHDHSASIWRVVVATVLVIVLVNVVMGTWWLVLMGFDLKVILWPRVIKNLIELPIQAVLIYGVLKGVTAVRPSLA